MTQDEYSEKVEKIVTIINESPQIGEILETVEPEVGFMMGYSAHIRIIEAFLLLANNERPEALPAMIWALDKMLNNLEIDKETIKAGKDILDAAVAGCGLSKE